MTLKEILTKRLNNFKKWNEELKGNYVGQITNLQRRLRDLEDKTNENK